MASFSKELKQCKTSCVGNSIHLLRIPGGEKGPQSLRGFRGSLVREALCSNKGPECSGELLFNFREEEEEEKCQHPSLLSSQSQPGLWSSH